MGFIAPILGLVGGIVQAAGIKQQGDYAAQVAENNAKTAEQNAAYAREAGSEAAATASRKAAAEGATIRAGLAANGVDVNTGSAADVATGNRETGRLDAETVMNNAELQAYGYTTTAVNEKAQAEQDRIGASFGAAGSLLSSASSIGFKFNKAA